MLSQKRILKGLKWTGIAFGTLLVIGVIIRIPHVLEVEKTKEQVAKIHATKLTLSDVTGENLPPDPGAEADKTVAGIDENTNGIRDDVELAIFKEYPDSARVRAALLQYALALQIQSTLPVSNRETATASVEDNESRALTCLWSLSSRDDMGKFTEETEKNEKFIKDLQFNTEERKIQAHDFYNLVGSYSMSHGGCDVNLSSSPN
jgi:hypothetical protein